jgi:hypothetical protein
MPVVCNIIFYYWNMHRNISKRDYYAQYCMDALLSKFSFGRKCGDLIN